jgi:hypothetical protein
MFQVLKPNIIYQDNLDKFNNIKFDYILAQSIFSHAGSDILEKYLISLSSCFKKETLFFFVKRIVSDFLFILLDEIKRPICMHLKCSYERCQQQSKYFHL